jgi:hypothetical protein
MQTTKMIKEEIITLLPEYDANEKPPMGRDV